MKVAAECIEFAWDSPTSMAYYPGQGPLPGGLYEIDSDSQLATLTTIRGSWIFQFLGHQGKDPNYDVRRRGAVNRSTPVPLAEVAAAPTQLASAPTQTKHKGRPMTEAHKAKLQAARATSRAAKQSRMAEATA